MEASPSSSRNFPATVEVTAGPLAESNWCKWRRWSALAVEWSGVALWCASHLCTARTTGFFRPARRPSPLRQARWGSEKADLQYIPISGRQDGTYIYVGEWEKLRLNVSSTEREKPAAPLFDFLTVLRIQLPEEKGWEGH